MYYKMISPTYFDATKDVESKKRFFLKIYLFCWSESHNILLWNYHNFKGCILEEEKFLLISTK